MPHRILDERAATKGSDRDGHENGDAMTIIFDEYLTPTEPATSPRPTWEMAKLFPHQGSWTVDEYLELDIGQIVEFHDGYLEFHEMPKLSHQQIIFALMTQLRALLDRSRVTMAPFPLRIDEKRYREPDILCFESPVDSDASHATSAILVIEVVSEGTTNRERDYEKKTLEYAEAGVAEYWIVDPQESVVSRLTLEGDAYVVTDDKIASGTIRSNVVDGFEVSVPSVFE